MTDDTYQHLEQLLRTVRRRLQELEKQEALFGAHTAPEIRIEIEDLQARIRSLEEQKKQLHSNSATGTSATAHTPPPPTLDGKSVTSSSLHLHRLVWIFITAGIILTLAVAIILYIPHPRMTGAALMPSSTSTSITAIEQQLNEANIVLTNGGPEYMDKSREYLKLPEYSSLANACLQLLGNNRLKKPLPLDVINGTYRYIVTGNSDTIVNNHDNPDTVKKALIKSWNDNSSDNITSLDQIIEPKPSPPR